MRELFQSLTSRVVKCSSSSLDLQYFVGSMVFISAGCASLNETIYANVFELRESTLARFVRVGAHRISDR